MGGGQSALATGYYLRWAGLRPGEDFVIVDAADYAGWFLAADVGGLRLFSPSSFSFLPGWMMPPWNDAERGFAPPLHAVDYLTAYEKRYDLAPLRAHRVTRVSRADDDSQGQLVVQAREFEIARNAIADLYRRPGQRATLLDPADVADLLPAVDVESDQTRPLGSPAA